MQPRPSAYIERQIERMIDAAQFTKKDRLIDIGCGIGKYTIALLRRGYRVEGLDIAEGLLQQLQSHNQTGLPLPVHSADIAKPPKALWEQYDAAIGFFALHHMFDLDQAFQGIAKLLKPKGKLIFIEPNPYNFFYYIQILCTPKMTWKGEKGILKMRPASLLPAMKRAGFLHPAVHRSGFLPPFLADLKGGIALEKTLEAFPLWKGLLPFQIFTAQKE
ncbi:MAG TPA: class I SAM-dependent methyltransferase [Chlamydiales bacterium]|nr:class I SAM-dependent methyltransferase [Chlamydiales bacterium]